MANFKPRPAHEIEAAGEPRWQARVDKGLLMVTDLASGEEVQATAFTAEGDASIGFSLPGDNGLRVLRAGAPGFEPFKKIVDKLLDAPSEAETASKPASEKPTQAA